MVVVVVDMMGWLMKVVAGLVCFAS